MTKPGHIGRIAMSFHVLTGMLATEVLCVHQAHGESVAQRVVVEKVEEDNRCCSGRR